MNNRPSQQTRFNPRGIVGTDEAARIAVEGVDRGELVIIGIDYSREWLNKNAPLNLPTARQWHSGVIVSR